MHLLVCWRSIADSNILGTKVGLLLAQACMQVNSRGVFGPILVSWWFRLIFLFDYGFKEKVLQDWVESWNYTLALVSVVGLQFGFEINVEDGV